MVLVMQSEKRGVKIDSTLVLQGLTPVKIFRARFLGTPTRPPNTFIFDKFLFTESLKDLLYCTSFTYQTA